MLTQGCNANCDFCYEKKDAVDMPLNVLEQVFKFFYSKIATDHFEVWLFGGEPTTVPKLTIQAIKHIVDLATKYERPTNLKLFTNGLIYNPDIVEALKKSEEALYIGKVYIQVSFEGENNHQRDGNNLVVREEIRENIKKYAASNLETIIRTTYSADNITDAKAIINSFKWVVFESGIKQLAINPVIECSWTEEKINTLVEGFTGISEILINFYKTHSYFEFVFTNFFHILEEKIEHKLCKAGKDYISVNVDGEIVPCQRFQPFSVYTKDNEYRIGDVMTEEINLDGFGEGTLEKCEKCSVGECNICPAVNKTLTGSYFTIPETGYCELRHRLWEVTTAYLKTLRESALFYCPEAEERFMFDLLKGMLQNSVNIYNYKNKTQDKVENVYPYYFKDYFTMVLYITSGISEVLKRVDPTIAMPKITLNELDEAWSLDAAFFGLECTVVQIVNKITGSSYLVYETFYIDTVMRLKTYLSYLEQYLAPHNIVDDQKIRV